MTTKRDLSQMESIVSKNARYYYETDAQGNKILRHILIGSYENVLQMPADGSGVTIDVLPADSVTTREIADKTILPEDISDELNEQILSPDEVQTIGTGAARAMVADAIKE